MTPTYQQGIILYGPPAAGKDTVTEALSRFNPRCVHFPPVKLGPGRTIGYRPTTPDAIDALRATGDIIWQHRRYGALYAIDRPALVERLNQHVPVLHLGHPEGIPAVTDATPAAHWLVVQLWCPRGVATERIRERREDDFDERMRVWDATPYLNSAQVTIDTSNCTPSDAAHRILEIERWILVGIREGRRSTTG